MLFCTSCGGWATSKPGKLARKCVRRTKWGAECLRLIASGWTPVAEHQRRPIHGTWLVADLRAPLQLVAPPPQGGVTGRVAPYSRSCFCLFCCCSFSLWLLWASLCRA